MGFSRALVHCNLVCNVLKQWMQKKFKFLEWKTNKGKNV
jgi:hypothetical protein